jgi:ubiquinone/menaquinone biosynthesis C-methylase UbiE
VNQLRARPAVKDRAEPDERSHALALSALWAGDLLDAVQLHPGERVLDLTCGTGLVARTAASLVLPGGTVAGIDLTDPALAVARGAGSDLPFGDASFDVVICLQGLPLLPDRGWALAEMHRVLVPQGRVAVSVSGRIERCPAFAALAESLERHAGVRVAAAVRWRFALPEPGDLRASLAGAGFDDIRVRAATKTSRVPSVTEFVRRYAPRFTVGSAAAHLSDDDALKLVAELETELAPWVDEAGLRVEVEANTGVARRS